MGDGSAQGRPKMTVLIVEDESPLAEVLRYNFEAEGFHVTHAATGEQAETLVLQERPDLVVLDWMLPELSGVEVCKRLRSRLETKSIPIVMLTGRGEEGDRIRGLASGVDDYVLKPFSIPELIARVKAILRRIASDCVSEVLSFADIELDPVSHQVMRGLRKIHLGPTEFRLLRFLMENRGHAFSRAELLKSLWAPGAHVDERTVDVHVGRLRKALIRGKERDPIRTIRGVGYIFGEREQP